MAAPLFKILQFGLKSAQVAVVKARFIQQMAPLQTFLASSVGTAAASVGVSVLAAAAAAAYVTKARGGSDEEAEEAAMKKGVSEAIAKAIIKYIS
ncbi:MAG: hypothetical protein ACRBBN_21525 [Methyloligellaceae bacterium]